MLSGWTSYEGILQRKHHFVSLPTAALIHSMEPIIFPALLSRLVNRIKKLVCESWSRHQYILLFKGQQDFETETCCTYAVGTAHYPNQFPKHLVQDAYICLPWIPMTTTKAKKITGKDRDCILLLSLCGRRQWKISSQQRRGIYSRDFLPRRSIPFPTRTQLLLLPYHLGK